RGEVAVDDEHLGAFRNGRGDDRRLHRGLRADRDAAGVEADEPGVGASGAVDDGVVPLRVAVGARPGVEVSPQRLDAATRWDADGCGRDIAARLTELGDRGGERA